MALQPRYDYGPNQQQGSVWFFPLMIGAVFVLSLVFAKRWKMVAPGLVAGQLVLAPFTTPRGDNDGLWGLILPILVVFAIALYIGSGVVARSLLWLRPSSVRARRR